MYQDADSIPVEEGKTAAASPRVAVRSCVVLEPAHAEKQHAREPGDLLGVLGDKPRPVREGHKPNGGRERSGEVGLRRSTGEPAEQGRATFQGGRGGKGAGRGEHRSITHASDTERNTHVPGVEWCATSSIGKEAGTVHRFAPPCDLQSPSGQLLRSEAASLARSRWCDVAGV